MAHSQPQQPQIPKQEPTFRTQVQDQQPHPNQKTRPSQSDTRQAQRQLFWYRKQKSRNAPVALTEHHRRYLDDVGALHALPKATADALLSVYVSLLDDLIPILDGSSVLRGHSNGQSSIYLVRAMCLVACKTKQAAPFLRLRDNGPLLQPLEFAARLLSGLDAAIKADLEPDRITKVRILALMHLHNDGVAGPRRSSSYLSQAICEAWSLSLHFTIPGNPDQESGDLLWWSLRNFDRLSKPTMAAAPFMIDDSDIAIGRIVPNQNSYRSQIMAIATALGDLVATATKVYKASSTAVVDDCQDFPSFSQITTGANLDMFHRSHRAYLEIWYCVAAMLSCRHSAPGSIPYKRRFTAAGRILNIVSHGRHESLPPLPLVPYAMSMSTTMIYRALRDNQINVSAAYKDLSRCCAALDELSQLWTSVAEVTKLAKRLVGALTKPETRTRPEKRARPETRTGPETSTDQIEAAVTVERNEDDRSSTTVADIFSDVGNLQDVMVPTSASVSTSWQPNTTESSHGNGSGEQVADPRLDFERQLVGEWTQSHGSYSQLDAAFHNLFDFGMPSVFRDQETWELF